MKFLLVWRLWEITIKVSLGKLELSDSLHTLFLQQLIDNDIQILQIDMSHLLCVSSLPFYHRDPFDRLIIAQSLTEKMPLCSIDKIMDDYYVHRIW